MEIRQLEYFREVCRIGHVTKASERLHVAQPSITVAIRNLEAELGVPLFDRTRKRLDPTAEGRAFLARVEAALALLEDAAREMEDFRLRQRGSIKIGVPPMIGAYVFPLLFARFKRSFPRFELEVVEEGTLSIVERLDRGELDVGIVMQPEDLGGRLETLPIGGGELAVCMPRGHRLAGREGVSFAELRGERFVLFREDTYSRRLVMERCAASGFQPEIAFTSSQLATVLGLVEQGVGVAFLLGALAEGRPGISSRPLVEPLRVGIGLAWNGGRYLSIAARAFIDFISALPEGAGATG